MPSKSRKGASEIPMSQQPQRAIHGTTSAYSVVEYQTRGNIHNHMIYELNSLDQDGDSSSNPEDEGPPSGSMITSQQICKLEPFKYFLAYLLKR